MPMRKTTWPAITLLLTALCSCGSDDPAGPADESHGVAAYYPLTPGSWWEYVRYGDTGVTELHFPWQVRVEESDGEWTRVTGEFGIDRATSYIVTDAFVLARSETVPGLPADTLLRGPLAVGETWEMGCFRCNIVAIDTSVTTAAGTFDSVMVVRTTAGPPDQCPGLDAEVQFYAYYAPGVGLVRSETHDTGVTGQPRAYGSTLVDYEVDE